MRSTDGSEETEGVRPCPSTVPLPPPQLLTSTPRVGLRARDMRRDTQGYLAFTADYCSTRVPCAPGPTRKPAGGFRGTFQALVCRACRIATCTSLALQLASRASPSREAHPWFAEPPSGPFFSETACEPLCPVVSAKSVVALSRTRECEERAAL